MLARPRRGLRTVGIVALGLVLTVISLALNQRSADRAARAAAERAVERSVAAGEADFARTSEIVSALAGFVMSSEEVERAEYERFVGRFLESHPEIRSLQLLDFVEGPERPEFEHRLRAVGVTGINEWDPKGSIEPAPERHQYLVTWFDSSEMRAGGGVTGLNVLIDAERAGADGGGGEGVDGDGVGGEGVGAGGGSAGGAHRDAELIRHLIDRNVDREGALQMIAGPGGAVGGVRLLRPVFDTDRALTTTADRKAALVGAAAAVVSPEEVFARVSASVSDTTDLVLSTAGQEPDVLAARVQGRSVGPENRDYAAASLSRSTSSVPAATESMTIADREVVVSGWPREGAAAALAEPARRWIVLIGALLTGVAVAGYLWWSRIRRLERMARALQEANEALEASATEMQALAERDHLTGLPNRQRMHDLVDAAMGAPGTEEVSVVLVDLDRFKELNDSIGHRRGDELLSMVAQRMRGSVRAGSLGRVGGDEFCVLLAGAGSGEAAMVAERLVAGLRRPFRVGDRSVSLTATAAVCSAPSDASSAVELMEHLDVALHVQKARCGDTWVAYDHSMAARQERRRSIEAELRYAVAGNGSTVLTHFQPKVDLATGRIVSAEGLARWKHPALGTVSPAEFIDVAEETGLIVGIGEEQIRRAVELLRRCRCEGLGLESISVNVSAQQFADERLIEHLRTQLRNAEVPAGSLVLEITESETTEQNDHGAISGRMRTLGSMGVGLSIDDFGTGYSSMSRIEQLPVDEVKVDQSFVAGLPDRRVAVGITRAILSMAHTLGIRVVAEGVETEAQRDWLIEEGCDLAQGWYYARAMDPESFLDALRAQQGAQRPGGALVT